MSLTLGAACDDADDRSPGSGVAAAGGAQGNGGAAAATSGTGAGAAAATSGAGAGAAAASAGAQNGGEGGAAEPSLPTGGSGGVDAAGGGGAEGISETGGVGGISESGGAGGEAGATHDQEVVGLPVPTCALNEDTDPGHGELLFNAPCDATGIALFVVGEQAYWQYESEGQYFVAAGPVAGAEARILVASVDPIWLFDVRGVVAFQSRQQLFVVDLAGTRISNLGDSPICAALTSTATFVYCRSIEGTIVRWPVVGGAPSVIRSGLSPGGDLVADPSSQTMTYTAGLSVTVVSLNGAGEGRGFDLLEHQLFVSVDGVSQVHLLPSADRVYLVKNARSTFDSRDPPYQLLVDVRLNGDIAAAELVRDGGISTPSPVSLFTPFPAYDGIVAAQPSAGDAATIRLQPGARPEFVEYVSPQGMMALTALGQDVYWLDRKGRVFAGHQPEL